MLLFSPTFFLCKYRPLKKCTYNVQYFPNNVQIKRFIHALNYLKQTHVSVYTNIFCLPFN